METNDQRVFFLRMKNGDDVISEIVELETDDILMYMLINPLKVTYVESSRSGYMTIAFMHWVFPNICEHQEFTVHAEDVLTIAHVSEKMNEYYKSNLESLKEMPSEVEEQSEQPTEDDERMIDMFRRLAKLRTYH